MAHFAEINNENVVVRVIVVPDSEQHRGQEFLSEDLGLGGTWLQTSYNTFGGQHTLGGVPFRKNYAAINYTYDSLRDAFIPTKPFESWELNEETCLWEAPTPMPTDPLEENQFYVWDEGNLTWEIDSLD